MQRSMGCGQDAVWVQFLPRVALKACVSLSAVAPSVGGGLVERGHRDLLRLRCSRVLRAAAQAGRGEQERPCSRAQPGAGLGSRSRRRDHCHAPLTPGASPVGSNDLSGDADFTSEQECPTDRRCAQSHFSCALTLSEGRPGRSQDPGFREGETEAQRERSCWGLEAGPSVGCRRREGLQASPGGVHSLVPPTQGL